MLRSADRDLIRRDETLPGLAACIGARFIEQMLQTRMPGHSIEHTRGKYLRYKPGTSCVAAFDVRFDGCTTSICVSAFRKGDEHKRRKFVDMSRSIATHEHECLDFENENLLVTFFPCDIRLKAIALLTGAASRVDLMSRILPDAKELWHGECRTLAYKPQRRYVGQWLTDGVPRAVIKLYTPAAFRTANRNAKHLQSHGRFRIAQRLGRSEHHAIMALQWLEGTLLRDALVDPAFDLAQIQKTGEALGDLHAAPGWKLDKLLPDAFAATIRTAVSAVSTLLPDLADRAGRLGRDILAGLAALEPVKQVIHGDFYPKQILLQPDGVAFIDLDEAKRGDPAIDLGNFLAHLHRHAISGNLDARLLGPTREALLSGYQRSGVKVDPHKLDLFVAAMLLRLAVYPFRSREVQWPERVLAIIERVSQILPESKLESRGTAQAMVAPVSGKSVDDAILLSDPAIPFLGEAIDPVQAQARLADALAHTPDMSFGHAHLCGLRVVRHKPGRRCLIEYDLQTRAGSCDVTTLIGKIKARGLDLRTYELMREIWSGQFAPDSDDGICVPEPITTIPSWNMWLQRKMPGDTASLLLSQPQGIGIARRLAQAAFKIHRHRALTNRLHSIEDELQILSERLTQVARELPQLADRFHRILKSCQRIVRGLPQAAMTGIHRDFYADQVLVNGSQLYLLDFDLYCIGDPALDIANAVAHLHEEAVRHHERANALNLAGEAMIEHYLQLNPAVTRQRIDILHALSLARHIQISWRIPERRRYIEKITERCELELASV